MKNIKIITTDVDGTLLNDQYVVSEENENIINKFINNDYYFVMNTGALPMDGQKILTQTNIGINEKTKWFVGMNGSLIYNFINNKNWINIENKSVDALFKLFDKMNFNDYEIIKINNINYLTFAINTFDKWYEIVFAIYPFISVDANKMTGFNNLIIMINKILF